MQLAISNYIDLSDLLKPTQICYVTKNCSMEIMEIEPYLVPPPRGLYLDGSNLTPVFTFDKPIIDVKTGKEIRCAADFKQAKGHLSIGKKLVPFRLVDQLKNKIRDQPAVNTTLIQLIATIIKTEIDHYLPYRRPNTNEYRKHLINDPEALEYWSYDKLAMLLDPIVLEVRDFMKNDLWHIYFVKPSVGAIEIQKTCDWRVYEWSQEQNELLKQATNKDELTTVV